MHINDPENYHNVYCGGSVRRVHKDPFGVGGFAIPDSAGGAIDHDVHRRLRGYLNPYFAPRAIVSMEPLLHERITALLGRLDQARKAGQPVSLDRAFSAMTADLITNYFFGYHYDYLSNPHFENPVREGTRGVSEMFHWMRFAPWLTPVIRALPLFVVRRIQPAMADLVELRRSIEKTITGILQAKGAGVPTPNSALIEALDDERIPPKERMLPRLADEGQVLLFAGTENSARALSVGFFYLLNNKPLLARAREDLACLAGIPDEELTVQSLEELPYLVRQWLLSYRVLCMH